MLSMYVERNKGRKWHPISIRIEESEHAEMLAQATAEGLTMADYLRALHREYVARKRGEKPE